MSAQLPNFPTQHHPVIAVPSCQQQARRAPVSAEKALVHLLLPVRQVIHHIADLLILLILLILLHQVQAE
jgi:hypothetical protein